MRHAEHCRCWECIDRENRPGMIVVDRPASALRFLDKRDQSKFVVSTSSEQAVRDIAERMGVRLP